MRRREFVRGVGILTGGVVVGGAVSTVGAQRGATVQQVVDRDVPQPQSVLTVDLPGRVDRVDAERIHVWTYIVDPQSTRTRARLLNVLDATGTSDGVRLLVDGPVSQGAVVSFADGSLTVDGRVQGAFAHAPVGEFLAPERATQWFKAYEPTNPDYFDREVYPSGRRPERIDDLGPVRTRLEAHLDRFVGRDRLAAAERDRILERFDDPTVRRRFIGHDGGFDAEALAGVLANAGTIGRGIDRVILDGENRFGRPYTVRRRPTLSGGCMEVHVDEGKPTILVDPVLDGEPFVVLAPLFVHEGFHQDLSVGLYEEIIATYIESLVWAEHVLADPSAARLETAKSRQANTMLLVALNSGRRSFPDMGLYTAPHRQVLTNAVPKALGSVRDFVSVVESKYTRTPAGPSPGTRYARQVVGRVTGTASSTLEFDAETLVLLDEQTRVFSATDVGTLLATLELRPAPSVPARLPAGPDPVAVADARQAGEWSGTEHSGVGVGAGRVDYCGSCLRTAARG